MKMKNKLMIGLIGLVTSLYASDTTNTLLHISRSDGVTANPTAQERKYSLLEKISLTEGDWNEIANAHGTGSNLAFVIAYDKPSAFYQVASAYEPIAPTNYPYHITHGSESGYQQFNIIFPVINYENTNRDVVVDMTVADGNPYAVRYTSNMPFTNTLVSGENTIEAIIIMDCCVGGALWGDIIIQQ